MFFSQFVVFSQYLNFTVTYFASLEYLEVDIALEILLLFLQITPLLNRGGSNGPDLYIGGD